jgi:hypothetical protein
VRLTTIALLSTVLFAAPAMAQSGGGGQRSGVRAAVGLEEGSLGLNCDDCSSDRLNSLAFMVRLGVAVAPDAVVSAEYTRWSKPENGGTSTASWALAVVQWYPQPASGFYLEGGVGIAALDAVGFLAGTGSFTLQTTNIGLEVGAGYDIPVSQRIALTPFADFLYAVGADPTLSLNQSKTGSNLGGNLLQAGVALSWR